MKRFGVSIFYLALVLLSLPACQPAPTAIRTPIYTLPPAPIQPTATLIAPTPTAHRAPTTEVARQASQTPAPFCTALLQQAPPNGFKTYCDADFGFAFQYPAGWETKIITVAPDKPDTPLALIRKGVQLSAAQMTNYIRISTYRLSRNSTLAEQVREYFSYAEREFPEKDYPDLKIGGQRAYAILNRWHQDYSAATVLFQHGVYYTAMELKAISAEGLETNWDIARSIQIAGYTSRENAIPEELISDSRQLLQ